MTFDSILTGLQSTGPDVYFARQYSFIAGPFVIYGGLIIGPTSGNTITLLPSKTLIHVGLVITKPQNTLNNYAIAKNITGNSFDIYTNAAAGFDLYYFAVGV